MELLTTTTNWISQNWHAVGAYAGFGALFSVLIQSVKTKFNLAEKCFKRLNISGKTFVRLLFTILTALPFVVDQILQTFNMAPSLNANFAWLFVAATWVHWFVLSPAYTKITQKVQDQKQRDDDAAAYRRLVAAQKAAATPPATTSPTPATKTGVYDPTEVMGH